LCLSRLILRDLARVEVIECPPLVFALAQDCFPAQSSLRAFENQELEQRSIVVNRHSPLLIVVRNRQIGLGPMAAMVRLHGLFLPRPVMACSIASTNTAASTGLVR